MTTTELRDALHAAPFQPFFLRMADGREYEVPHPDFLFIHPKGRTAIVAMLGDKTFDILDIRLITSIHYGNGRKSRRRRKAG